MTDKELEEKIDSLEAKIDRLSTLEGRLEGSFKKTLKFKQKLIDEGYPYEFISEFDDAISPVVQACNEFRKKRAKLAVLKEELEDRKLKTEALERQRAAALRKLTESKPVPNERCRHYSLSEGRESCEIRMDMTFCGTRCPYATTERGHYRVDARGNVIPKHVLTLPPLK